MKYYNTKGRSYRSKRKSSKYILAKRGGIRLS